MDKLLDIQKQLTDQLLQVNRMIANQPTPESSTTGVMDAINAAITENERVWLYTNIKEMVPFLQTPEGKAVINHALSVYKIYKGYTDDPISSTTGTTT